MTIERSSVKTPIHRLGKLSAENELYIKRDDLYPLSFGGNKARKAELFWKDIQDKNADYVVTYGSSSSNHCRVIANLAAMHGLPCTLISPEEESKETFNSDMMRLFGAKIVLTPVEQVKSTIDTTMKSLAEKGYRPYFIMGGGHGNIGTQAYVDDYREIKAFESSHGIKFDYIFHASGTGTTQAGLVCGQLLEGDMERRIVGISIARKNPYGRNVVVQSVKDYLESVGQEMYFEDRLIEFTDAYAGNGYGKENNEIKETIHRMLVDEGIPLDITYTGKAFWGMCDYLKKEHIKGKRILFIHTGGTPLFFDYLNKEFR